MNPIKITLHFAMAVFLTACADNSFATPTQTSTPEPTQTQLPTGTPPPTQKPIFTLTPTSDPAGTMGDTIEVLEGGYSFQEPVGYDVEVTGGQTGVFDKEGTIIISIYGGAYDANRYSLDKLLEEFLMEIFKRGDGEYTKSELYPITVDGVEGISYDLTGTLFGSSLKGQTFVVSPGEGRYLYGLGIANTGRDKNRWENKGSIVFGNLTGSLKFLPQSLTDSMDVCEISTDQSYGYSQDNPIRVGGDAFNGPSRARAFLDNLLGPGGEPVSYQRISSLPHGDTILDMYSVAGSGINATLYVDQYSFSEPQAPVGFICKEKFSLKAP